MCPERICEAACYRIVKHAQDTIYGICYEFFVNTYGVSEVFLPAIHRVNLKCGEVPKGDSEGK